MLDKEVVWRALGQAMPMTALLRNLATLTRVGVIAPMDSAWVCETLKRIGTTSHIHPIACLTALLTYRAGKGVRGQHTWTPVPQVVDALDAAFDRSFSQAPQTNQRLYLGIDVSGSMGSWRGRQCPRIKPQDGSGGHGDGHCPERAELLHGRVRGQLTGYVGPRCIRHVAPEHHGI